MLPTPHLKVLRTADGTIKNILQWWHKPGWTKLGDTENGEWRDLPSETIVFVDKAEEAKEHELPSWTAGRIPEK